MDRSAAQAKGNGDTTGKWLTFWLDKQLFGVPIDGVEQIVSMQPITVVPEYPAYAKGIINLRGTIIPLIDFRLRLGKPETEYNDHTCIIINNVENSQLGFIVDEVDAVIDIPQADIAPPPQMGGDKANRYLTGVARISDDYGTEKMVLCLNAAEVLKQEEFGRLQSRKV
ncbi:MAG: chemotaxis protein CheW [Oscillospiraceae bacterium]|nr:chemotaxis protein CheW [Oscillospiraceae bacterium]